MAKFNLGNTPKNFKREVLIEMLDGTKDSIVITFIYRTRSEYAKFVDSIVAKTQTTAISPEKAKKPQTKKIDTDIETSIESALVSLSLADRFKTEDAESIDLMLQIAEGWDLTEPFNRETLQVMQDRFPNSFAAINQAYSETILKGRLKN